MLFLHIQSIPKINHTIKYCCYLSLWIYELLSHVVNSNYVTYNEINLLLSPYVYVRPANFTSNFRFWTHFSHLLFFLLNTTALLIHLCKISQIYNLLGKFFSSDVSRAKKSFRLMFVLLIWKQLFNKNYYFDCQIFKLQLFTN